MKITAIALGVFLTASAVTVTGQAPTNSPAVTEDFYTAIRNGDTARVSGLLAGGADVNAKERRGGATPLMQAAAFGSLETMKVLIDKGADVNARSNAGATALMWAATDLAKVRLLIDRGADVNAVSESGRTALLLAAMSARSSDIVRLLLSRGADPRVVDKEQTTTLVAAATGNDLETIRQLVAARVDVNAPNIIGATPLMIAASNDHLAAAQLLLASGATVNAVGAPPGAKVKNGIINLGRFTPLILASSYGPVELVRALLDAGANVNAADARGMTPLMYAVATDHGDPEIARLLLARGADVNARTPEGETAADWAHKSGATPMFAVIQKAGGTLTPPMPAPALPPPAPTALRAAVERSVPLLERSAATFFTNGGCSACHAQHITDIAAAAAKRTGFRVDSAAAAQRPAIAASQFGSTAPRLLERFDGPSVDIFLSTLASFAAAGYAPDRATDAMVFNVIAQQSHDGRWHIGGVTRVPMADGDFSRTALAILALDRYGFPARPAEMNERIRNAVAWLQSSTPLTAEDRSFRLLGLKWGGADRRVLEGAASDIGTRQRTDGGWGQRDEMASDAYASGLTMYALLESGSASASSDVVQRATKYLLSTQRADGSWYVRSRVPKFQPYFDGGFPYEHDQWISAMATGWATAALATSLPGGASAMLR